MGLGVQIGILASVAGDEEGVAYFEKQLRLAGDLLEENDLPRHVEPPALPAHRSRAGCDAFPYSFLHYLRRAAAHRRLDPAYVAEPLGEDDDPTADPAIEDASDTFDFHLLVHSDCEGFYVPVDFTDVIFDDDRGLAGGMLGSSVRLRDELVEVAPALGVRLGPDGGLSDAEARRVNGLAESDDGLFREYTVWIALYEAARLSIELKTAIAFT